MIPSGDGGDFVPSGRFRGPTHVKIAEPFTITERVEGERIVVRHFPEKCAALERLVSPATA
ncbi:hypothetical protein ACPZ19_20810 [Amycolatopsis lurida]